jgi:hypothetical protein
MDNLKSARKERNFPLFPPLQQSSAQANAKLILPFWWFIFSFAAVFQMVVWHDLENIACALIAWTSCILTGFVMIKPRVLVSYPWSSLMVLMFCLATCGLPLLSLLLQWDPMTFNLEVPVATFSHLLACQILLLLIHLGYRNAKFWRRLEEGFRMKVLRPSGLLDVPSWVEALAIGAIGLASSVYVFIILPEQNGGESSITGPVLEKFVQGLCPLTFAPFLLLFSQNTGKDRGGFIYRVVFVVLYTVPVLLIAWAYNTRSQVFLGFAIIGIYLSLLILSGKVRLSLGRIVIFGVVSLLITSTIGTDVAVAMRVARENRSQVSALEIVKETFQLLTSRREEIAKQRELMSQGNDYAEAWYVTSPLFSRFICTQFQDRTLAIGLALDEWSKEKLRHVEFERVLTTLPNPVLNLLSDPQINLIDAQYDKNEVNVGGASIGAWMLYLGGSSRMTGSKPVIMDENGKLIGDVQACGGFIGDGFAAYGWGYLLIFGGAAFLLFAFSDSLYGFVGKLVGESAVQETNFAMVGLVNGYALATALTLESIAEILRFLIRQPLQWMVVYGLIFFGVRFVSRTFFSGGPKGLKPRISMAKAS